MADRDNWWMGNKMIDIYREALSQSSLLTKLWNKKNKQRVEGRDHRW